MLSNKMSSNNNLKVIPKNISMINNSIRNIFLLISILIFSLTVINATIFNAENNITSGECYICDLEGSCDAATSVQNGGEWCEDGGARPRCRLFVECGNSPELEQEE